MSLCSIPLSTGVTCPSGCDCSGLAFRCESDPGDDPYVWDEFPSAARKMYVSTNDIFLKGKFPQITMWIG